MRDACEASTVGSIDLLRTQHHAIKTVPRFLLFAYGSCYAVLCCAVHPTDGKKHAIASCALHQDAPRNCVMLRTGHVKVYLFACFLPSVGCTAQQTYLVCSWYRFYKFKTKFARKIYPILMVRTGQEKLYRRDLNNLIVFLFSKNAQGCKSFTLVCKHVLSCDASHASVGTAQPKRFIPSLRL